MSVNTKMTAIADEIRTLSGATVAMGLDAMATNIGNANSEIDSQADLLSQIITALEGKAAVGDIELPTLTNEGSAGDMLSGKQLINSNNEVVTGTIPTKTSSNLTASGATVTVPAGYYASQATKSISTATQATPSITVSSAGLITAKATQTAGYVAAGTKSATKQLTTQAAQTITPGTSNKTIASGRYLTGTQTIKGDANLVAGNIKSGVSIFGVAGTLTAGGGSVDTATIRYEPGGVTTDRVCIYQNENGVQSYTGSNTNLKCVVPSIVIVRNYYDHNYLNSTIEPFITLSSEPYIYAYYITKDESISLSSDIGGGGNN